MLRFLTAGESHGPACVAILEGMPAGVLISTVDINKELEKRHSDFGRGARGEIEKDKVEILAGIRFGKTLGSPICLLVKNLDFLNWQEKMSIKDRPEIDKEAIKVTRPRPGHADLAGVLKYGQDDIRNISERASARETVMRVAVGAIIKQFLLEFGIKIASHTVQIGSIKLLQKPKNFAEIESVFQKDPEVRCLDKKTSQKMKETILKAKRKGDTLGGVVEVVATGVPPGLGSMMHNDRRLDGAIAKSLMSIPSVKAVEIGNAIQAAKTLGSKVHDEIFFEKGKYFRKTNNMGGIEGGVSNGEKIICRVYHKPISTLKKPLKTIDIKTKRPVLATVERSDVCVVPRAGVVSESMLAFVLGQAFLEKFGGDHLDETKRNFVSYLTQKK